MAQLAVIIMCPSERGPPAVTGLFASKATKRAAAQKYDFVPGNKIIKNPCGNGSEVCERPYMAFQKSFSGLGRKRGYEAIVGMGQVHRQVVRLLFHAGNHHQRFAEVRLCFARRMRQRNEHLPAVQLRRPHVVLHDRVAANETVLFLQPLKDPLRCVPLLRRSLLVIFQNGVDHTQPRPQLGTLDRLLSLVAWRHRVLQHLPYRLPRKPKIPGYRSLTPALDTNRPPYTPVYFHLEHPSGVPCTMPSRQ